MAIEDTIVNRLHKLIEQGTQLNLGGPSQQVRSEPHRQQCAGWLTSANHCVSLVCPDRHSAYREAITRVIGDGAHQAANRQVGEAMAILRALADDIEGGLITSITDRARAEVFDDFLEHGEHYVKSKRKNEAGVIAGVVFEDALRRVCRKRGVAERGQPLDELISELARRDVLTATKAKRARVAAHVRTKATHAQWDEFDLDDVTASIAVTHEIIAGELEA